MNHSSKPDTQNQPTQFPSQLSQIDQDSEYQARFGGIARLYGQAVLEQLKVSHVGIIGIGGVGTWVAEAMARSGVGHVTLVDLDDICVTNTNRQIHATSQTVGLSKVQVMKKRMLEISPYMRVECIEDFFTSKTADLILNRSYHCLVDAIDDQKRKSELIAECLRREIPIMVSGGAGGRQNPQWVTSADLSQSTHDGLLRNVKRALRTDSAYSDLKTLIKSTSWGVPSVFSTERPVYPTENGEVCHTMTTKDVVRLDCQLGFGASSFVTGTFGFQLSSLVINCIKNQVRPIQQGESL